jgi:transporter family protein
MWVILAFISALCLGFYDVSKKIALKDNGVVEVLTASVWISSAILFVPLLCSRLAPDMMTATPFYVPRLDLQAHLFTLLKSVIVLSSWIFAYVALKHLPISVVSPWQATRPMWTLIGAMLIFGERLNGWQWAGVLIAIGSIFVFSLSARSSTVRYQDSRGHYRYAICMALAILIGSCSGLYDKYMMRLYDHNAVQVYYTFYQAFLMLVVCAIHRKHTAPSARLFRLSNIIPVIMISLCLVISDNVYMLALRDPDSMIAVVSTIRRGGTVIGFAYGLLFLKEKDPWKKIFSMLGILVGLVCLALGSM